jgi:hypothetical protein
LAISRKAQNLNHEGHEGTQRKSFETYAKRGLNAEVYANLGWVGMTLVKAFGILVEYRGEGYDIG